MHGIRWPDVRDIIMLEYESDPGEGETGRDECGWINRDTCVFDEMGLLLGINVDE